MESLFFVRWSLKTPACLTVLFVPLVEKQNSLLSKWRYIEFFLSPHSTFDRKLDMKLKDEEQDIPQLRPHPDYRLVMRMHHLCICM